MNDKPLLFTGDMIRALLREIEQPGAGKTQTRRVIKPQPRWYEAGDGLPATWSWAAKGADNPNSKNAGLYGNSAEMGETAFKQMLIDVCPYGQPGDLLWVREGFRSRRVDKLPGEVVYKADHPGAATVPGSYGRSWKPSIHMPRWASRLTLRITDVRVERVQDISEADAIAEGINLKRAGAVQGESYGSAWAPRLFRELWDSINAAKGYGWKENPWVWVIEFEVIHDNIDNVIARGEV